jgi:hypothetical protein
VETWKKRLSDQPDAAVINRCVTVDQDIAKSDDLAQIWNAPRELRREFGELV